jgi:zinc protease
MDFKPNTNYMRKFTISLLLGLLISLSTFSQTKIAFREFTLDNGLHVIMHQDNSTPIVSNTVFYHVGSKNENQEKTGYAHFFEHLMFEGSENIDRGQFALIVQSSGGTLNAGTSPDFTFYYEILPSNQLELALYLESERMLHAKIDQIGVDTQRDVIKQEMKEVMEDQPYMSFRKEMPIRLFPNHPYKNPVIGSAAHLDQATLADFKDFYNTFYVPNNATLVVAGDIDYGQTEALIRKYFGEIPRGSHDIPRPSIEIERLTAEVKDIVYDNIQLPAIFQGYQLPRIGHPDTYAIDLLSTYLLSGKSSLMYRELVDGSQKAVQAAAFPNELEDGGMFIILAIANMGVDIDELNAAIDEVLIQVQKDGIDQKEFEKLLNIKETQLVNNLGSVANISLDLAQAHVFHGNADFINQQLEKYSNVKPEDIQRVANEYLKMDSRVVLKYLPKSSQSTE